jgi:hypothetical protein
LGKASGLKKVADEIAELLSRYFDDASEVVRPVVKPSRIKGGKLAEEASLPPQEKIVQKIEEPQPWGSKNKPIPKKATQFVKVSPELFHKQVNKFRNSDKMASGNIHPYSVDDYKKMDTYLSTDAQSGYALKDGDELVSVHSAVRGQGRGDEVVADAVKRGARRLDAFDIKGKLPKLYERHGFKETARYKFDPQYADPNNTVIMEHKPDFVEMRIPDKSGKMSGGKKAAAVGATFLATTGMTPEEAEAASVNTIMDKTGLSRAMAETIKYLAKTVRAPGSAEDKIQAIQSVRKFKQNPKQYKQIGRGMEQKVYDVDGNVVKVPHGKAQFSDNDAMTPAITEASGLGAKTTTVRTPKQQYQVQELLQNVDNRKMLRQLDPKVDTLLNLIDDAYAMNNYDLVNKLSKELDPILNKAIKRDLIDRGLKLPKLPENVSAADYVANEISKKAKTGPLSTKLQPEDIHSANVAFDPNTGQVKIIDTGYFGGINPKNLTSKDKQMVRDRFVGSKQDKKAIEEALEDTGTQAYPETMSDAWFNKKAAAIAPAMGISQNEFISKPLTDVADMYKKYVKGPIKEVSGDISEKLVIDPKMATPALMDWTPEMEESRQQSMQQQKSLGSGILEMGLDPSNYMGLGFAAPMLLEEFETPEEIPEELNEDDSLDKLLAPFRTPEEMPVEENKRFDKLRTGFDR